jgi:hypothetical protein
MSTNASNRFIMYAGQCRPTEVEAMFTRLVAQFYDRHASSSSILSINQSTCILPGGGQILLTLIIEYT